MRVSITHGTRGSPDGNWFPWISSELKNIGHKVICPRYPTPEKQSLNNWLAVFDEKFGFKNLDNNTVLIGHSIGAAFALRLLCKATAPVKACFLVSGFTRDLGIPEFDELNSSFIKNDFNWDHIHRSAEKIFIYHSDNDPYVPLELSKELASNLDSEITLIPGGGHLNADSGFTNFPQLKNDFLSLA